MVSTDLRFLQVRRTDSYPPTYTRNHKQRTVVRKVFKIGQVHSNILSNLSQWDGKKGKVVVLCYTLCPNSQFSEA